MKKIFLMIGLMTLVACSQPTTVVRTSERKACVTAEEKKVLADFIIKCNESANPKSDEEGEDLVIQCERTGNNTLCPAQKVCQTITDPGGFMSHKQYGDWTKCEERPAK